MRGEGREWRGVLRLVENGKERGNVAGKGWRDDAVLLCGFHFLFLTSEGPVENRKG